MTIYEWILGAGALSSIAVLGIMIYLIAKEHDE